MLSRLSLICLVAVAASSLGAAQSAPSAETLQKRQAFLHHLMPDATPAQIEAALGKPDTRRDGKPAYRMRRGVVTIEADKHGLKEVEHLDPGDGSMGDVYYRRRGPRPSAAVIARREKALSSDSVTNPSEWTDPSIGCSGTGDACAAYTIRDGYVVVQAMYWLMGATGPLASQAAKVTLHRHGRDTVVYRAWDNWDKLRPATATDAAVAQREAVLRRPAAEKPTRRDLGALGPCDGHWGSGVDYQVFWLPDGLLISAFGQPSRAHLSQPGADRQVGLKEWLAGKRPARKR